MTRVRMNRRRGDFDHLWLITFADLMVQLMAFFALAYSFQNQERGSKLNEVLEGLRKALGVASQKAGTGQPDPGRAALADGILEGLSGLDPSRAADLEKLMTDLRATDGPEEGRRLRLVSFRGGLLFDEGSATVNATFQPLLTKISELVRDYPGFQLVCEGHAAPGERGRNGADALELSAQRANAAVRFLVQQGVPATTLTAESRGDAYLDGDPRSPEGRALHRRVKFRFQRVAER